VYFVGFENMDLFVPNIQWEMKTLLFKVGRFNWSSLC